MPELIEMQRFRNCVMFSYSIFYLDDVNMRATIIDSLAVASKINSGVGKGGAEVGHESG